MGGYLRTWPPPGRVGAPAMVAAGGGRHRKDDRPAGRPEQRHKSSGATPAAIPPHPPLVSGGWYHSLVRGEVLGPGRYPVESPTDKSIGAALALSAVFGPAGLCYTSIVGGLIASGVTLIALIVFGFVSLAVIWPLSLAAAAVSASRRQRRDERQ